MISAKTIEEALQPPAGWQDTPEQAQLRECLGEVLKGHDDAETIRICYELITLMRDQLMTAVGHVRRRAASSARVDMNPAELARASGQSRQTISRLLTEARSLESEANA